MTADNASLVLRVPGRLSYGCTDLTAAWPHGGTGLGPVKSVTLIGGDAAFPLTQEAKGGVPVEYVEAGEVWGLGCIVRTFRDGPVSVLFRNSAAGTVTQRRVVTAPGTVRAGNWASGRSIVLVFTPEGSTHAMSSSVADVDAPFVVLYRAIPLIRAAAEMDLERGKEFGIPALFQGIPDASGRTKAMAPRQDISFP